VLHKNEGDQKLTFIHECPYLASEFDARHEFLQEEMNFLGRDLAILELKVDISAQCNRAKDKN
jgi:hypothetical protein